MEIKQITDKKIWEDFVLQQEYTLFVQSPAYGEFFERMGEKSWIFGVYNQEKLIGGSLVVSTHAKRGNFLYLPYGPIGNPKEILSSLAIFLKKFAKENNFDFVRISPFWSNTAENQNVFKENRFQKAPMHILAENTWLLDLEKTENELLVEMEKTHRYLIKRCEKEGVKIEMKNKELDLNDFNKLHDETAKRHHFHRFSKQYISDEFKSFAPKNQAAILNAYLPNGEMDSSAIIIYYGQMAAYRHGASLNLDKKLSTSYLIQWEAIKEAKKRGIKWYNFWGIAPENAKKNHPFYGITHFKKGFGGFEFDLLPCQDLPITKKYWLNWLVETIRSLRRGFK